MIPTRWFALLAAAAFCRGSLFAAHSRPSGEPVRIAGQEHLRLSDWASANALDLRWLKRDETLQLAGRTSKARLNLDSRETQINGVTVWLSFPVIQRNGVVYVASDDGTVLAFGLP